MILVDAGYLIALFNPDDQLHDRATAWSERLSEPMLVTEYVLWECVNFLSRPPHRASAHAIVHWALSDSVWLPASPTLLEAGLALHRARPDKEWSLTDCVSFHVMGERGERGLTGALAYDGHFEQAGFEALLRLDPPNHGRA